MIPPTLYSLRNVVAVSERVLTAGQPRGHEIGRIRAAGFDVVINLAMPNSTPRLSTEAKFVTRCGMNYIHIPVPWDRPTAANLDDFVRIMDAHRDRRVFVHCALNRRASSFVFLDRVIREGAGAGVARAAVDAAWVPNRTWRQFMNTQLTRFGFEPIFSAQ